VKPCQVYQVLDTFSARCKIGAQPEKMEAKPLRFSSERVRWPAKLDGVCALDTDVVDTCCGYAARFERCGVAILMGKTNGGQFT
jgi:hypothetical protein